VPYSANFKYLQRLRAEDQSSANTSNSSKKPLKTITLRKTLHVEAWDSVTVLNYSLQPEELACGSLLQVGDRFIKDGIIFHVYECYVDRSVSAKEVGNYALPQ